MDFSFDNFDLDFDDWDINFDIDDLDFSLDDLDDSLGFDFDFLEETISEAELKEMKKELAAKVAEVKKPQRKKPRSYTRK